MYQVVEVAKKLLKALSRHFDALLPLALDTVPAVAPVGSRGYMARRGVVSKVPSSFLKKESLPSSHSYSHGFEKIYALETVDVATVRLLDRGQKTAPQSILPEKDSLQLSQVDLDFGFLWRNWITPCFLSEPLQVLELSKQAESVLVAQGYCVLKDLLVGVEGTLSAVKGLGQGAAGAVVQ
jgi:hypothetical protein